MAFLNLDNQTSKVSAPRDLYDEGWIGTAVPPIGANPIPCRPDACIGCEKETEHNLCPLVRWNIPTDWNSRYLGLNERYRPTIEDVQAINASLWMVAYAARGMIPTNTLYNVGYTGANSTQWFKYEVISASERTLTLKGKNPQLIPIGRSIENPDWVGPGLGEPRLITSDESYALTQGAVVEFLYPSILQTKRTPIVLKIYDISSNALDDVTFKIDVNQNIGAALKTCNDIIDAPSKMYCNLRWEALFPPESPQVDRPLETHWVRKHVTFQWDTSVIMFFPVELLGGDFESAMGDPSGSYQTDSTRVLYPEWFDNALVVYLHKHDGTTEALTPEQITARLDTSASWGTELALDDLDWFNDYESAEIWYWCEDTDANEDKDKERILFQANCSADRVCANETYSMGTDEQGAHRRCHNVNCSGFLDYRPGCWLPDADFSLGDTLEGLGESRPDHFDNGSFWGGLWTRADWTDKQGEAGGSSHRNFCHSRPTAGGPGLGQLFGGFRNQAYSLVDGATTWETFNTPLGSDRIQWTDDDGNTHHRLTYGAFYKSHYDYSNDDGPVYNWTAGSTPSKGFFPTYTEGWSDRVDARGNQDDSYLPYGNVGKTSVSGYNFAGHGLNKTNKQIEHQCFSVNMQVGSLETDLATWVRARI